MTDPQEAKIIGLCASCGGEIYEYAECYTHDGNMIHGEYRGCVKDYAIEQIKELTTKEVAEIFEMEKVVE